MARLLKKIVCQLFVLLLVVAASPRSAQAAPFLRIDPLVSNVLLGDDFFVDVWIDDVTDLFAYDVEVTFNPAVLQVLELQDGTFLNEGNPLNTIGLIPTIDNSAGWASGADSRLTATGVSGSGILFRVKFDAFGLGTSAISFDVAPNCNDAFCTSLRDSDAPPDDEMAFEIIPGEANVTQPGPPPGPPPPPSPPPPPPPIPEPSTLALIGLGLAATRIRSWRRRR